MTAHATRPTLARCDHGHFIKPGARCRRCNTPTPAQVTDDQHATRPRLSIVKPIPPLARRHPDQRVPLCEAAAARAAMAARATGIYVPVAAWHGHPDGTATALLNDGTHLHHRAAGPTQFTAAIPCPGGSTHIHTITNPRDLEGARRTTGECTVQHADFTGWVTIAARDLTAAFAGRRAAIRVVPLPHKDNPHA